MVCPKMQECALFPLFSTKAFLRIWQINYCEGDFVRCVRYQQTQQGFKVSSTLLPNGKHLPVIMPTPTPPKEKG